MSLIKCPECKRKISSNANICPRCGYPLQKSFVENNVTEANECNKKKNQRRRNPNLVEDIFDRIISIPIIGYLICIIFFLAIGSAILIGLLYAGSIIFEWNATVGMILLLLSMNVVAFFSSYRWGCKKYGFWLSLAVTILFLSTCSDYFF